ncbi:hypothetical protein BJ508DRAFT_160876 [Ascobolus immersus RN42]|uniref:Uncharacterized protein n=1 Tax=Ascobolus immersus RN42 TaxID=1160509 RepID=A0A3N4I1S6_ASCIM|nr:hypothetical protein BJ508DRAFT_160876 [Ascobolus immersus RN42]
MSVSASEDEKFQWGSPVPHLSMTKDSIPLPEEPFNPATRNSLEYHYCQLPDGKEILPSDTATNAAASSVVRQVMFNVLVEISTLAWQLDLYLLLRSNSGVFSGSDENTKNEPLLVCTLINDVYWRRLNLFHFDPKKASREHGLDVNIVDTTQLARFDRKWSENERYSELLHRFMYTTRFFRPKKCQLLYQILCQCYEVAFYDVTDVLRILGVDRGLIFAPLPPARVRLANYRMRTILRPVFSLFGFIWNLRAPSVEESLARHCPILQPNSW